MHPASTQLFCFFEIYFPGISVKATIKYITICNIYVNAVGVLTPKVLQYKFNVRVMYVNSLS